MEQRLGDLWAGLSYLHVGRLVAGLEEGAQRRLLHPVRAQPSRRKSREHFPIGGTQSMASVPRLLEH
eukprot:2547885-Heterocapsa_arctica.AAC.1